MLFNIVQNCTTSPKPITLKRLLVQVCSPFLFIPQPQATANLQSDLFWTFHTDGFRQKRSLVGFPSGSAIKNLPVTQETQETHIRSLGSEDPLEEHTATHSSILAWEIPWTEGHSPWGRRVWNDWAQHSASTWPFVSGLFQYIIYGSSKEEYATVIAKQKTKQKALVVPWHGCPLHFHPNFQ